jgi:hypothetical protein
MYHVYMFSFNLQQSSEGDLLLLSGEEYRLRKVK